MNTVEIEERYEAHTEDLGRVWKNIYKILANQTFGLALQGTAL